MTTLNLGMLLEGGQKKRNQYGRSPARRPRTGTLSLLSQLLLLLQLGRAVSLGAIDPHSKKSMGGRRRRRRIGRMKTSSIQAGLCPSSRWANKK